MGSSSIFQPETREFGGFLRQLIINSVQHWMTGAKYHQNHKIRRSVSTLPAYVPLCRSLFGDFLLLLCSNAKWSKLKGK